MNQGWVYSNIAAYELVCVCVCVCVRAPARVLLITLSCVRLSAAPWTPGRSLPGSSAEFSRQEYWNGLPFPNSGYLPNPGIELASLESPALAGRLFTTSAAWEALP